VTSLRGFSLIAATAALLALPVLVGPAPAWAQAAPAGLPDLPAMLAPRVLGDAKAPVTILEFASLTCPHCAHFDATGLPALRKAYIDTGKVKLEFHDFPFDNAALHAAMLSRCVPAERYYGVLDELFQSQENWERAADPVKALTPMGRLAGLGEAQVNACMNDEALGNGVVQERVDGEKTYGVNATPTFIIQGAGRQERVEGDEPLETFAKILDKMLPGS
jgi:protein-disulfide isomerase